MSGKTPNDSLNIESYENPLHSSQNNFKCTLVGLALSPAEAHILADFFSEIPVLSGLSFVVVTHLSSDYNKIINTLKSLNLSIPLVEVSGEVNIDSNKIYYPLGNRNLLLLSNKICAVDDHPINDLNSPIDIFFNSLGYTWKEMAVGVLLSGLGSDGAKGALSIKQNGGRIYVQDPLSIRFNAVPIANESLKMADKVLTPKAIAKEVLNAEKKRIGFGNSVNLKDEKTKLKLESILKEVYKGTQVNFGFFKETMLLRRIEKRMNIWKVSSLGAYNEVLKNSIKEVYALFKELLVGSSSFFKDPEIFTTLKKVIFDELEFIQDENNKEYRIWCVGCSTGEEAYSVAIALAEFIEERKLHATFKIFASDIDQQALDIAGEGIYANHIVTNVNPRRLNRFFYKKENAYEVKEEIRSKIVFAYHNIFTDPAFVNIDLVVCRNLLLNLKKEGQKKILKSFEFSLKDDGFLLLGLNEKPTELIHSFSIYGPKYSFYQKTGLPKVDEGREILTCDLQNKSQVNEYVLQSKMMEPVTRNLEDFTGVMVHKHVPPCLFVNEEFNILYAYGNIDKVLHLPFSDSQTNLLQMLSYDNALIFRSGIRKALNNEKVLFNNILIDRGIEYLKVNIHFESCWIQHLKSKAILIEFHLPKEVNENRASKEYHYDPEISERVKTLELELNESKIEMRSLLDQLETSNEELLSSNEELQVLNEDLNSFNEEVQAINGELTLANSELNQKVFEISRLHDDLDNILKSIEIGIVFLDTDLKITWITQNIRLVLGLDKVLLGKPVKYLSEQINHPEIVDFSRRIMGETASLEIEIDDLSGKNYLLRLLPYKKKNQSKTSGVVITFVDITLVKKAEQKLVKSEELHRRLIAESCALTWSADPKGKVLTPIDRWEEFTGQSFKDYQELGWLNAIHEEDRENYVKVWKDAVENKSFYNHAARLYNRNTGKFHHVEVRAVPFLGDDGEIKEWFGSLLDVNSVVEAQQNLGKQKEHLQLAFDITEMGTYQHNLLTQDFVWDERMFEIFGFQPGVDDPKEIFYKAIHPKDLEDVKAHIEGFFDPNNGDEFEFSYSILRENKEVRHITTKGIITRTPQNDVALITGIVLDETQRKEARLKLIEKTKELETSNRELEQFAYVTTHDLRAPIINLKQLIKIFKRRNYVTKENQKLFDQMETSISELHETLHDLIAIVALKKPLDETIEKVNFKEILEKILISIMEMVKEAGAEMLVDFEKAPVIQYIPGHIKSILLNLLSNAIKYRSEERELHIEIKTVPCADDFICLSVKDNGIGIDPSQMDKLFGLFQRLRDDKEGKGVGLFITKSQVESLGGRLEVESEPNVGSTFKVYLKNAPKIKGKDDSHL